MSSHRPNHSGREPGVKALQDLEFIRRIIEETRQLTLALSGGYFVFWGLMVLLAVSLTYVLAAVGREALIPWVWWVLGPGAGILARLYSAKRAPQAATTATRFLGYLWTGLGLSFTLLIFIGQASGLIEDWRFIFVIVQVFSGAGVWITGGLGELRLIQNLGVAQWMGGALLAFLPDVWVPLAFGVFSGLGYLGAAWLLRRRGCREPGI
jgi:hypothetical protein